MEPLQSERLPEPERALAKFIDMKLAMIKSGAPEWELALADDGIRRTFYGIDIGKGPCRTWSILPQDLYATIIPAFESFDFAENPVHWLCDAISEIGIRGYQGREGPMGHVISNLKNAISTNPSWVNARDNMGNTPLHWAVYLLATEAVEILIEAGADTEMQNSVGMLALDIEHFRSFCLGTPKLDTASQRVVFMESFLEDMELHRTTMQGGANDGDGDASSI